MLVKTQAPLAVRLRKGDTTDPFVAITETNRVISDTGVLVMKEFPVNDASGYLLEIEGAIIVATLAQRDTLTDLEVGDRVFVQDAGAGQWAQYVVETTSDGTGANSTFTLLNTDNPSPVAVNVFLDITEAGVTTETLFTEMKDPTATLGTLQYRVDYEFGLLSFNADLYGGNTVKRMTYAGRGAYYIAASRVYDDGNYSADDNDEFTTLQDILNSVKSINVNSTTTGAPGTDAAVTVTGTSFDFTIPRGAPFTIAAEYASVADLSSETPSVVPNDYEPELFDLVIINTGSVQDEENAQLYIYDGEGAEGGFTFVSDLSGATGPTRNIQWKSETTGVADDQFIIRWANSDNSGWDANSEKNLALTPSWDGTELTITREEDQLTASYDLGITPSWTGTTLTLSPNDGSTDAIYDLGITASFAGSVLTLSPNDGSTDATYDVGITPSWNGSELIISPNNGDPDITYDVGITPSWNNGTLIITPNDGSTTVEYDLGWDASFTGTTLTFTPDDGSTATSADLGVTPSWTDTTLSITPNIAGSTPVDKDLGITPSWSNSTLTLTPNFAGSTPVSADLGLTASFNADELTIESNLLDGSNNPLYSESVSLGLDYTWGGTGITDTTLTIQDKVGGSAISQELGTYAEWGDGDGETITSVRFQNGDGTYTNYQELGLDASFSGTELTITTPEGALDAVDLQADSPTITASATTVAYTEPADVFVTEPTPNTFNLAFNIPTGEPLSINVVYTTIENMNANTSPIPSGYTPSIFDLAVIQSPEGAENVDNAKLFLCTAVVEGVPTWLFISDLSGAKGETGPEGPEGPDGPQGPEGPTASGDLIGITSISDPSFIQFDTTISPTITTGTLGWNTANGALSLGLSNTKQITLGEEQVFTVRNETGSTLSKGMPVYANGVTPSGRITVAPYIADGSIREVRFMGLVAEDISNGVNGFVQEFGYVRNLDTRGTAATNFSVGDEDWQAGDILYVHPTAPGKLTNIKPKHEITVAIVILRHQTTGLLFVRPTSAGHLADIHDVVIDEVALDDGDVLVYNSATDAWVNSDQIATLGSFVAGVKEINEENNIQFWVGTQAEYDLIGTPNANTLYFITDN